MKKFLKDPRIIILFVLGLIILLLLIASLFTTKPSPKPSKKTAPSPTSLPSLKPVPSTSSPQMEELKNLFEEKNLIDPPQIDSKIAL